MKVIGFNKPTGDNGYLSIYYQAPFYQDGLRFETVEQCFLYQKALTFHDEYRCKKILQTFDSKILNQLVKDIVNYDDKIFSGRKQIVLYQANLDKFRYNIEKKYLWNRISYRGVLWVEDIEEESQVSFKKL